MILALIAAMDRNRVIGKSGSIPWHLPADFAHFKSLTMGHPIIMGERTFFSLGKPLTGRTNIVLSYEEKDFPGCSSTKTLEEAIALGEKEVGGELVYVIGGGQVYALAMPLADRLEITHIDAEIDGGDTFFPEFNVKIDWQEVSRTHYPTDEKNEYSMDFIRYDRRL